MASEMLTSDNKEWFGDQRTQGQWQIWHVSNGACHIVMQQSEEETERLHIVTCGDEVIARYICDLHNRQALTLAQETERCER